jgi:hypothetical protein
MTNTKKAKNAILIKRSSHLKKANIFVQHVDQYSFMATKAQCPRQARIMTLMKFKEFSLKYNNLTTLTNDQPTENLSRSSLA